MPEKAWYIGNTTIRNAKRLKDGLRVLVESPLHGNLTGKANEQEFARLLHNGGVVFVNRLKDSSFIDASDVGRKWRAALMQLGFIKPDFVNNPFTITPNGNRLLQSENLPGEQECFLRSLLAHQIPSPIESFPEPVFSPLRIALEVLAKLEDKGYEAYISKDEMASIVQLTRSLDSVDETTEKINQYRIKLKNIEKARERKRFVQEYRESAATSTQSANTLNDYADSNFRYLKLTGLFLEDGRKLRLSDNKRTLINQILSEEFIPLQDDQYLKTLWNGKELPTDDRIKAIEVIKSLVNQIKKSSNELTLPDLYQMNTLDLSQLRLKLEDDLLKIDERKYALDQVDQWRDILIYLIELTKPPRKSKLIPSGEAPAYLEWALWRAFLAINSLVNEPWEARRFRIDQEFLPIGPAPGNGPDMIFEFDDFVLVVEVTLTSSSRQEAAEGEPVRRHVANMVDEFEAKGKRVYGLFIANNIDTNTAETFRIGVWYRPDDTKIALRIVPITLIQFINLFESGFNGGSNLDHRLLERIIRDCLVESNNDAPEWKRRIDKQIDKLVNELA